MFLCLVKIISVVVCHQRYLTNGNVHYNREIDFAWPFPLRYGHPVGTVASFSCNSGFTLSGTSISNCDRSGSWTGQPPRCNKGNENKYFQ